MDLSGIYLGGLFGALITCFSRFFGEIIASCAARSPATARFSVAYLEASFAQGGGAPESTVEEGSFSACPRIFKMGKSAAAHKAKIKDGVSVFRFRMQPPCRSDHHSRSDV